MKSIENIKEYIRLVKIGIQIDDEKYGHTQHKAGQYYALERIERYLNQ